MAERFLDPWTDEAPNYKCFHFNVQYITALT